MAPEERGGSCAACGLRELLRGFLDDHVAQGRPSGNEGEDVVLLHDFRHHNARPLIVGVGLAQDPVDIAWAFDAESLDSIGLGEFYEVGVALEIDS